MATCNDCYGTNTAQPCASVGCLSTNYGKCITYSGSNLFCQKGSIATFTFTGVAVAPTLNTTVTASATGGNGTGATFTVVRTAGETTYTVTLDNPGSAYEVSDALTIAGTLLGGASPANDITISVTTLAAVIANGDDLDKVIANINNRLCLVSASSPSGLDYTAFNYQCLRVGGNLEGVGTVITTAQGFTEAVASALCSLNTRLKGVELPPIIVDSYFSGSLISETSTLTQVLNEYGEAVGDLNDKFTVTTSSTCGTFVNLTTLTAKPSPTASLGTWFDWVSTNVCTNFTTLDSKITEQTTEHTTLNNFLYGVNQAYPNSGTRGDNFVDTACLPGGSATSNVRAAVDLIASELCSLKSIVTAGPTSNYTVSPVSCLNTPFSSSSVFGVQKARSGSTLIDVLGTTTLQGHLNQIYSVLSNLNISFTNEFIVTEGACGPTISLASGSSFTCSALANCDLNSLGDVTYISTVSSANVLVRNNTNEWVNARIRPTIVGVHDSNTVVPTYNAGSNTLDINLSFPLSYNQPLIPSPLAGSWLVQFGPAPHITDWPILQRNDTSGIVIPSFYPGVQLVNNSGGNLTINDNASVSLLNIVDNTFLIPTLKPNMYFPVSVVEKTSGGALTAIHNCLIKVYSIDNATLTSGSYSIIDLVNVKGGAITVANGNTLDIYFGGITWSIV